MLVRSLTNNLDNVQVIQPKTASETPKFPIFRKNPEMRLKHQNSPKYAIFSETLGTQSIPTKPKKNKKPRKIAENRGEPRAGLRR